MVLSADEGENVSEGERGDTEEDPEEGGGLVGIVMHVVVDLGSAVMGNGTVLDVGETSEDRRGILAVAGTLEINLNTLKNVHGAVEVTGIVGVLETELNGVVGSGALGESVYKALSWECRVVYSANVG